MLRGNRFRLLTLGRLTLLNAAGDEDASLAKRRRKLALLAVLAMARRPISRATLLEMFWGEQDEARARHSLSNALSSLRRALGQQSITTRDADVALATDAPLDVDALDLGDAVETGDFARAVELYGGPFVTSVYVDDGPSFDQWVTRERRRIEILFLKGCSQQCALLARGRRWPECHALAARWIDTEPLSADAAIFLLNATKAPGTRAALAQALDEYERLRVRLAADFDLAPEPVVRELAARIRDQLAIVEPDVTPDAPSDVVTQTAASPSPLPSPSSPPAPEPPFAPSLSHRHPALRRVAGALAAATIIGVLAFRFVVGRAERGPSVNGVANGRRPVIAVLAMEERSTDSTIDWLVDGLPQMITGKLAHIGAVDVIAPARVRALLARSGYAVSASIAHETARDLGRRVGATIVAHGTIGRDGGNLVLDLTIHDARSGNLVRTDVLTRHDALALADEAAARILGAANVSAPGAQLAELETSSLDAYQHFVRGLDAGQAGRHRESLSELDAAIAIDSGFITALRERIGAAISDNDTILTRRLRETMRKHFDRATEFDRLDQEAGDAFYAGERDRSEALARGLVRRYPRDPRAYQLLENILSGHGKFEEAGLVATEVLALDSLAMDAGNGPCTQCVGFFNIVNLNWGRGDFRVASDWARRWIRAQPDAPAAWESLAWTYSYMQRPDSALPLMQRAVSLSGGDPSAVDQLARMLIVSRRYGAADSAIAVMELNPSPDRGEAVADLRTLLEREHGRYRAANRVLDRLAPSPNSSGLAGMVRASNLRALGDYAGAARWYDATAHSPKAGALQFPLPASSARGFCWHHALAADAFAPTGDTLALRAAADTLEAACVRSFYGRDWRLYHHVRGLVAMRGERYAEAEREFTQAVWTPVEGWSRTTVELARAQAAQGRPRDAIATLRAAYATRLDAMARYVPISELDYRMAGTFAQAGQADSARVYAAYVRNAWRDADPEVRLMLAGLP
jgi:DNA-binding SARP family transcriptional activator/tetratricopeptide (TPR) repeat protein